MIKFYALQVKMKNITLEDIPEKWRDSVEEYLAE